MILPCRQRWRDNNCNETLHLQLMREEAEVQGVHFFWGSGPLFSASEAKLAASLSRSSYPQNMTLGRLLYACCSGTDQVFEQVRYACM